MTFSRIASLSAVFAVSQFMSGDNTDGAFVSALQLSTIHKIQRTGPKSYKREQLARTVQAASENAPKEATRILKVDRSRFRKTMHPSAAMATKGNASHYTTSGNGTSHHTSHSGPTDRTLSGTGATQGALNGHGTASHTLEEAYATATAPKPTRETDHKWRLDSGATRSLTPYASDVSNTRSCCVVFLTADGAHMASTCSGDVTIRAQTDRGSFEELKVANVCVCPSAKERLLSTFDCHRAGVRTAPDFFGSGDVVVNGSRICTRPSPHERKFYLRHHPDDEATGPEDSSAASADAHEHHIRSCHQTTQKQQKVLTTAVNSVATAFRSFIANNNLTTPFFF